MQPGRVHEEDSDSEDDPDYVPPTKDESSDEEREAKKAKLSPPKATAEDEAEKKRAAEALWQSFKASAASPQPTNQSHVPKMVKIEKRYRFAGEDVVEIKEVFEDSEDAKKWPRWNPPAGGSSSATQGTANASDQKEGSQHTPAASSPAASPATSTPSASSSSKPAPSKRRGPRKPKTTLAPLPGQQSKAKKLTVLDKSAMDWKAHVESSEPSSGLHDELAANRRGGGYLEKVDFLQRVEARKEEALEANKSGKRRRG